MPSEQEIQFHRTFLSLPMCRTIYNEDERYQNYPGGPPNRQRKIESDPFFKYHIHSCPKYPQRAPGLPIDRQYNALLARSDGGFEPLEIITKRGMGGQRFASVATQWELQNSVLCGPPRFYPVVNSWMEVTGHCSNVPAAWLIHPEGIYLEDISDYITNEIPIFLWTHEFFDPRTNAIRDLSQIFVPSGWEIFEPNRRNKPSYHGGVDVLVLPNGDVIGAKGNLYTANNGMAISVMSPIDFLAPGRGLVSAAIRGLTNRVGAAVNAGFQLLRRPTKELAESSAARVAGRLMPGGAVTTGGVGVLHVERVGGRVIIMADDMQAFKQAFAKIPKEQGFYDVVIHGDTTSFYILEGGVWKKVSVSDVARAIRPGLGPGDQIRLLACEAGVKGGPAQQLANELHRTVWAPNKTLYPVHGEPIKKKGKLIGFTSAKSFVPEGGKFYEFTPHSGTATLAGKGGKVTGNELKGEIRTGDKR